MKDDIYNKYYDTYNKLADKYDYEDESAWWPELTEGPTKFEKLTTSRRRLLNILQEIANNSGFNTNAPDEMYITARKLFDDLSSNLDDRSKSFDRNKSVIKDAEWALFNKLDYMRAKELIQKVE